MPDTIPPESQSEQTQDSEATSETDPIVLTGNLFDLLMIRPVGPAFIEFQNDKETIQAATEENGFFSVDLPHGGNWAIVPASDPKGKTAYHFDPHFIAVDESMNVGDIGVLGLAVPNATVMRNYVANVIEACHNIFEDQISKYDPNTLTEDQVKTETARVFAIANAALRHVLVGAHVPETEELCKRLEAEGGLEAMDLNVSCQTCQYKYANNQAMLQQCICCPDHCY